MHHLIGIGDKKQRTPTASTQFQLKSTIDSNKSFNVRAFILPGLASTMPSVQNPERIVVPPEVSPLADTDHLNPREIDLILGADIFKDVVLDEKIKTSNGLYFRKTDWLGSIRTNFFQNQSSHAIISCHLGFQLEKILGSRTNSDTIKTQKKRRNSIRRAFPRYYYSGRQWPIHWKTAIYE